MAVNPSKTKPQFVKDFWPRFKRRSVIIILLLQVLILVALAALLSSIDAFKGNMVGFVVTLVAQSILGVVASLVIYYVVARPVKHLLAALVHVAGEPTTTTPPNPNEAQFERTGFKPVLQTIYKLASTVQDPMEEMSTVPSTVKTLQTNKEMASTMLTTALDQTICGFVVMGNDHSIVYANKSAPITIDQNGVQSLELLFNGDDTIEKWWEECEQSAVHAEKTWSRVPNKLPDDENRRFFDIFASYSKDAANEMVISLIDRTQLYEVGEEELDFIAFAAHELRGPVTIIRGYVDVLTGELDSVLQPDQKELFRRITVSANRLSGYINNILNTSRYDRRHLHLHLVETTIQSVYEIIRDDMELRALAQHRVLTVTIPDGLPTIAAETASLSEVFSNLIDNAIKYSNEGGLITVSASSKGDTVEFSVEDHGIGMPSNVVSNLFQKFYRSHRSRETVAGTGIGLYISKAIVESHGGTISVRSEDGHGSTFIIALPTYAMVADKLKAENNDNKTLINSEGSWIKNHNMYRG